MTDYQKKRITLMRKQNADYAMGICFRAEPQLFYWGNRKSTTPTVRKALKENSFRLEWYEMTDLEKRRVAVLRSQGQSYGAIADALHVSVNSVKTFCRRSHG